MLQLPLLLRGREEAQEAGPDPEGGARVPARAGEREVSHRGGVEFCRVLWIAVQGFVVSVYRLMPPGSWAFAEGLLLMSRTHMMHMHSQAPQPEKPQPGWYQLACRMKK